MARFLFSGEGPTDLGTCRNPEAINQGDQYLYGPLTVVVDRIVNEKHSYSLLDSEVYAFVPEAMLVELAKEWRSKFKSGRLPGTRTKKETMFFYWNARAFAKITIQYGQENKDDEIVAVFYRDGDKPNERGNWEDKRNSILAGFNAEEFQHGVPMIPKSVSEAWILCAIYRKRNSAQNCGFLEDEKHGLGARHQLKDRLETELGEKPDRETLCEKVKSGEIDPAFINLNSFEEFKKRLNEIL